jgi:Fe-S cluster assembly protein SufD
VASLSPTVARGVRIEDLSTLLAADDAAVREKLGAAFAGVELTPATAGTYVEIAAGVAVDEPIVIEYRADGAQQTTTTLIVAGIGARATIVERITGGGPDRNLQLVCGIFAEARADVTATVVQRTAPGTVVGSRRRAFVGAEARLACDLALLGGAAATDELIVRATEPGATVEIAALFFPTERETVGLTTEVQHLVRATTSQTVVRSIAAGHGRGRYYGNIKIDRSAHGADASLRDDTLLIGKDAHIDAIPALEISANDVKAFHGATVGAIDEEHIFYLMSRGIERTAAQKLIALGFFEPAVSRFPGEALRDELRALLEAKLVGAQA